MPHHVQPINHFGSHSAKDSIVLTDILEPHQLPSTSTPHRICGLYALEPGKSVTLADIPGPGCIGHLFYHAAAQAAADGTAIWWDDEEQPSVECPVYRTSSASATS